MGIRGVVYSGGGEPLLWQGRKVLELIEETGKWAQVALLTNASLFPSSPEKFGWLKNSTYVLVSWHGHQRTRTLQGIARLVSAKKAWRSNCMVNVKMVLTPQNYRMVIEDYERIKALEPDFILFCPSKDYENVGGIELTFQQMQELKKMIQEANILKDTFNNASILWNMPDRDTPTTKCESVLRGLHAYITADGSVYLCCCTAGVPELSIGNINEESFSEIWRGKRHEEVVKNLHEQLCRRRNCRFRVYNQIFDLYREPPPLSEYEIRHGGIL